jgi:hypothetical protein
MKTLINLIVQELGEMAVSTLADVDELSESPPPLGDVTNIEKRKEIPTITVSKLPAPVPVDLPTRLDIEPSQSPPPLDTEDVELGQREEIA